MNPVCVGDRSAGDVSGGGVGNEHDKGMQHGRCVGFVGFAYPEERNGDFDVSQDAGSEPVVILLHLLGGETFQLFNRL